MKTEEETAKAIEKQLDQIPEPLFLLDQPLSNSLDSRFGHEEIATALSKITSLCLAPFTIGLFGKWGSGKSTIVLALKDKLASKSIPVVIFDVWKHQNDALRRTFLQECLVQLKKQQFSGIENHELSERLSNDLLISEKRPPLNIPWNKLEKALKLTGPIVLILLAVVFRFFGLEYLRNTWQYVIGAFATIWTLAALVLAAKTFKYFILATDFAIKNFVSSEDVVYSADKFKDPHEFEKEFENLISALRVDRLVIVFDNLDRVQEECALEVLATIKTFLEPKDFEIKNKDVVFVIPCDADAIRKHIEKAYEHTYGDYLLSSHEFLRKFFNSILWIPEFIPGELESFTREMLELANIHEIDSAQAIDRTAWIITKAYRNNPRQIKQFINILLANIMLVRERQGNGKDFPENFLRENVPQLIRYLLLHEVFPGEMEKVREAKITDIRMVEKLGISNSRLKLFIEFIEATNDDFPILDIRIFFTLRRSEQEKRFPGIEDFFTFCEDKLFDDARKYIERIEAFEDRREELSQVIKQRLRDLENTISVASTISTLLRVMDATDRSLTETGYAEICSHLVGDARLNVCSVDPNAIERQILKNMPQYRNKIIDVWMTVLKDIGREPPEFKPSEAYLKDLMSIVFNNPDWFDRGKVTIQEFIENQIHMKPWLLRIVEENMSVQKLYVNEGAITNLIGGFSSTSFDGGRLPTVTSSILALDPTLFTSEHYANLIVNMTELQNAQNEKAFDESNVKEKLDHLMNTRQLVEQREQGFDKISDPATWDPLIYSTQDAMGQTPNWDFRAHYVPLLYRLSRFGSEERKSEINQLVNDIIGSASLIGYGHATKGIESEKILYAPSYEGVRVARALQDQGIFDYYYEELPDDARETWLTKLMDHDMQRYLSKLESENYRVVQSPSMTKKLMEKVESLSIDAENGIDMRTRAFKVINALKCTNSQEQRDYYAALLARHLRSFDQNIQKIGMDALDGAKFLGKDRTRRIIKELFDFLKGTDVTEKYQPSTLRAIYQREEHLNKEEKNEFLQFTFDELLRKSSEPKALDLGFEVLRKLRPKYRERKSNFDDIKARYEREPDQDIKTALANGLRSLEYRERDGATKEYKSFVVGLEENRGES